MDDYQGRHDIAQRYLGVLMYHVSSSNQPPDHIDISLAYKICQELAEAGRWTDIDDLFNNVLAPNIHHYRQNERMIRFEITNAKRKGHLEAACNLMTIGSFRDGSDLIKLWDECQYQIHERNSKNKLTSLAKFRVRQKFPPPKSICPSGSREKSTISPPIRELLTEFFESEAKYPSTDQKLHLAEETGLTKTQIHNWFANRRRKVRAKFQDEKSRKEELERVKQTFNGAHRPLHQRGEETPLHTPVPPGTDRSPFDATKQNMHTLDGVSSKNKMNVESTVPSTHVHLQSSECGEKSLPNQTHFYPILQPNVSDVNPSFGSCGNGENGNYVTLPAGTSSGGGGSEYHELTPTPFNSLTMLHSAAELVASLDGSHVTSNSLHSFPYHCFQSCVSSSYVVGRQPSLSSSSTDVNMAASFPCPHPQGSVLPLRTTPYLSRFHAGDHNFNQPEENQFSYLWNAQSGNPFERNGSW